MKTEFNLNGEDAKVLLIPETQLDQQILKMIDEGKLENETAFIEKERYPLSKYTKLTIHFKSKIQEADNGL